MHWMVYVFAMAFSGYAFSEANLCRVADTHATFLRAMFFNKLDSMRTADLTEAWNFQHDSDGRLKMQVGYGDTVDFQWSGLSVRSQWRGEPNYQVIQFNQDLYPVSEINYDSSGFANTSSFFRYGDKYYVEFHPDVVNMDSSTFIVEDSVVFTQSGLKRYAAGSTLIQECETFENFCLCVGGDFASSEDETAKFFSTGGLLDSVQYRNNPTVLLYWSRAHSGIRALIKPRQIRQGEAKAWLHRRDILGRKQRPF